LFNESLVEILPRLVLPGDSGDSRFFVYGGTLPIQAIARGVATAFPNSAQIVELASDYLRPRDGSVILDPLLTGHTLVLIHIGDSKIPGRLAEYWPEFAQNPGGFSATVTANLMLSSRVQIKQPGALIVIQETPHRSELRTRAAIWPLVERDAAELAAAGREIDMPISTVGVQRSASSGVMTMKDLCLLHNRDPKGTPRFSVDMLLNEREGSITWTDLQDVIRSAGINNNAMLDWLYEEGRVDDEKYAFARASENMLWDRPESEVSSEGYTIFPSIYDVVWHYNRLDNGQYIFRGQLDAKWTQESTLLRYKRNGESLDVGELIARVQTTEAFFADVRKRQFELFNRELDEESLLAVAQHYGFPTPLLDYTWSLRVAAFFATLGAQDLPANDRRVGVIYYINSSRAEFGAGRDPAETIGLPGFSLLDAARIRVGAIRVIEPELPDEDNRIARQSGVFIGGFARLCPHHA
jgi:hypothetical protein